MGRSWGEKTINCCGWDNSPINFSSLWFNVICRGRFALTLDKKRQEELFHKTISLLLDWDVLKMLKISAPKPNRSYTHKTRSCFVYFKGEK